MVTLPKRGAPGKRVSLTYWLNQVVALQFLKHRTALTMQKRGLAQILFGDSSSLD